MKIVWLNSSDYANFSYNQSESLKSVGVNSESYTLTKHEFGYKNQSILVTKEQMIQKIKIADIVVIAHSHTAFIEMCRPYNKRLIVYHTGSPYRMNPAGMNAVFNPIVYLTLTDQCEFLELGAKNIYYNAAAINVASYNKFGHQIKLPYKVAHYPSNAETKGTSKIHEMLNKISSECKFHFTCSTEKVDHETQLKRMDDCDIYIELFKLELRGKPYGCFGVTAFEAAAAGKIVITNNIFEKVYENAYGECALIIANDEPTFIQNLEMLLKLPNECISRRQTETYNWLIKNHSYEANGKRLKQLLNI